jgi:hypothetical protein
MQRFTTVAVASDLKPYEPLKEFVYSFFQGNHPIKRHTVGALEYVEFVKDALRFDQYFSTSYYIERDESNYYALFFVSPHIYGFETILNVKWQLDEESGRGFRQPEIQPSFFDQEDRDLQKLGDYEKLENILQEALIQPKTNQEIHEIVLRHEFLPKHAAEVFKNWQTDKRNFRVMDGITKKPARKGSFYITWDSCNPAKHKAPQVVFSLD